MGWKWLGVALALVVLVTGCSGSGADSNPSQQPSAASTPSATRTGPSIEAQLSGLAEDALAIDPSAEVLPAGMDPAAPLDTMFKGDSYDAGRGVMYMMAALTVSYPGLDGLLHARDFLKVFKRNGFGPSLGYHVDDIVYGAPQRSEDLQCRAYLEHDAARLSCIPNEFFDFVEFDVADELTTLYADEVHSVDIGGWEVLYPLPYDAEPPLGAILRTNAMHGTDEFRAYVDLGEGWELVARSDSYESIGRAVGQKVCPTDKRAAFRLLCPGGTA